MKSFDREAKMAELGVVDIVRMQPSDFPKIDPTPGWEYSHFNIVDTKNRPAKDGEPKREYLIARIESSAPGREPILSPDGALIAECREAIEHLSYDELTPEQLKLSLEGMRDVPSLLDEMEKRYSLTRGLSRQQIIEKGLGYTLFRILRRASASNIAR